MRHATSLRAEALSKCYVIRRRSRRTQTFREMLTEMAATPFRRMRGLRRDSEENAYWALRDVSFEVRRGEALGIIGRNGAGKSTLLKILNRITEPTRGRVEIRGRVASLLEVGTGFHPELTGRENIFLNGAILGMPRAEIRKHFDEIVAFAGTDLFLDIPVKHYSSGMYVRLAFAVATHFNAEIMLIDEVLAVGDVEFQRRCIGKMGEVTQSGRTVLLVSHNLSAISNLCHRALWIDQGRIVLDGDATSVVRDYLTSGTGVSRVRYAVDQSREAQIKVLALCTGAGFEARSFPASDPVILEFHVIVRRSGSYRVVVAIWTATGEKVLTSLSSDSLESVLLNHPGEYTLRMELPGGLLAAGAYSVSCSIGRSFEESCEKHENALQFSIVGAPYPSDPQRGGILARILQWQCTEVGAPRSRTGEVR